MDNPGTTSVLALTEVCFHILAQTRDDWLKIKQAFRVVQCPVHFHVPSKKVHPVEWKSTELHLTAASSCSKKPSLGGQLKL